MISAFEEIEPQANQFRDKFQMIINSIKALGKQLADVKIREEDVAQQFIPLLNDAKNTILGAIQKETSADLQEIKTFDDVLLLGDRAKGLLNRLGETGGSHSRTMHSFFGKYAKVLKFQLSLVDKEMKGLNELIDRCTAKTASLTDCKAAVAKVRSALSAEDEFAQKCKELGDAVQPQRSRENEIRSKIEEFRATEEFAIYTKNKEDLRKVNEELRAVLLDLSAAFSRISRPLSKYTYEIGLDKESNNLIQSVLEDPVNLMSESRILQAAEVLNKVKDAMQKGRIATKNPEKDIENIDALLANLHDYVMRYNTYQTGRKELQEKTSAVHSKLQAMYDQLKKITDDIQQKESHLNEYNERVIATKSTVEQELKKISDRIEEITGTRIRIVL
jgi:DNA repair exonuclease SbcCD ATPase subunit